MFFLYCTEIAMLGLEVGVGLATIKTFLMLLFLLKLLFSCMLRSVAFYIRYKMGR